MSIIGTVHGSKDISEIIDSAKREIIDIYKHHKYLRSLDVSIYLDVNSGPTIECRYEGFADHD